MGKCLKRHLRFLVITAIIFLLPQNVSASNLVNLSDRMSRGGPNIEANHEIKFLTPSGIEDSSQYLQIIFDTGFNLSSIVYNDIDLFHGPVTGLETEEILNSIPTAMAWGVLISGNTIKFTHPTDNILGDILPNEFIVLRIGTNASGGTHKILNPASIGSKIISITGNFSDSGKLAVAIFRDQVGINAGEQGGGGLPPPPAQPTINPLVCPNFKSPKEINGTMPAGTTLFINGSADNINNPSFGTWRYLATLNLGDNFFDIVARDSNGQNSSVLSVNIVRWRNGDTNGNFIVDDFDLSGVAHNWETDWCFGDFNEDDIVDDFDLSGLAAHWDSIY